MLVAVVTAADATTVVSKDGVYIYIECIRISIESNFTKDDKESKRLALLNLLRIFC
jgi:hypothetical protein